MFGFLSVQCQRFKLEEPMSDMQIYSGHDFQRFGFSEDWVSSLCLNIPCSITDLFSMCWPPLFFQFGAQISVSSIILEYDFYR